MSRIDGSAASQRAIATRRKFCRVMVVTGGAVAWTVPAVLSVDASRLADAGGSPAPRRPRDHMRQGTIVGDVRDAGTGAGIPGATVSVVDDSPVAETDAAGRYVMELVEPGEVIALVVAPGYRGASRSVAVTEDRTVTAHFSLHPTADHR